MKRNKSSVNLDILKKYKKMLRNDEILKHDHPIHTSKIYRDKSKYTRKHKHQKPLTDD